MSEQEEGLQGRLVVGSKRDGRRKYDENAKRELIQACLKPGVSIARTAMDHGINPNLVRTWISQYQREQGRVGVAGLASEPVSQAWSALRNMPKLRFRFCIGDSRQAPAFTAPLAFVRDII